MCVSASALFQRTIGSPHARFGDRERLPDPLDLLGRSRLLELASSRSRILIDALDDGRGIGHRHQCVSTPSMPTLM
jgi:hypothetical protein